MQHILLQEARNSWLLELGANIINYYVDWRRVPHIDSTLKLLWYESMIKIKTNSPPTKDILPSGPTPSSTVDAAYWGPRAGVGGGSGEQHWLHCCTADCWALVSKTCGYSYFETRLRITDQVGQAAQSGWQDQTLTSVANPSPAVPRFSPVSRKRQ